MSVAVVKTSEYLKYEFTREELASHAKDLARKNQQLVELELKKKQLAADIKAETEASNGEIARLARWVNDGYDYRMLDCEVRYNDPESGKKATYRTDTGEWVKTVDMLGSEKQRPLFTEEPVAVTEVPATGHAPAVESTDEAPGSLASAREMAGGTTAGAKKARGSRRAASAEDAGAGADAEEAEATV